MRPEQLASHVKNRVMLRASPRRLLRNHLLWSLRFARCARAWIRPIYAITSCGKSRGLFSSSGAKVYVHKIYFRGVLLSGGEAWCYMHARLLSLTLSATNTRFGSQARYAHAMAALRRGRLAPGGIVYFVFKSVKKRHIV